MIETKTALQMAVFGALVYYHVELLMCKNVIVIAKDKEVMCRYEPLSASCIDTTISGLSSLSLPAISSFTRFRTIYNTQENNIFKTLVSIKIILNKQTNKQSLFTSVDK